MLDIRWIRENPAQFDAARTRRALPPAAEDIIALDAGHRDVLTQLQQLQSRRNQASKEIGQAMAQGWASDAEALKAEVTVLKAEMQAVEEQERLRAAALEEALAEQPNVLADSVPDGADEAANVELRRVGEPPKFDFAHKQHFEIGEALGLMDFAAAARMSGTRFVVLKGALARMERALAQFMLDTHTTEFGYTEISPPMLVREQALYGTGQLPKFAEDQFHTADDYWLIPTAEVPLTNLVRDQIIDQAELPQRVTAFTACFRSEAGAAGKDTRGMIRHHQFYKVELVSITHPDRSGEELERMTGCAEAILQRLELPYRVVVLASGDTGFAARRTHDIEVWLPGQDTYREISSCSNCGDFQARRMRARFRPAGEKATRYVHTLNGSGVAIGRAMIAIIENNQRADGTVHVPTVLRSYMGGVEIIGAHE